MEYKITKIRKYGKGVFTSEMIGTQYYNIVYAHLYRKEDQKRIKPIKVHFIHMFDNDDLCEFYNNEKEHFSQQDVKQCRDELVWAAAESLFYGNDLKQIVKDCNYTIERYA